MKTKLTEESLTRLKFSKQPTAEDSIFIQRLRDNFKVEITNIPPKSLEHAENSGKLAWVVSLTKDMRKKTGDFFEEESRKMVEGLVE